MKNNFKGRSFLSLLDYSPEEINELIDLSAQVKKEKKDGIFPKRLKNKNIALLFEKNSTRTRCAFTVAAIDEGAHPEFLGKNDIQFGKKESVAATPESMAALATAGATCSISRGSKGRGIRYSGPKLRFWPP